jgi:brefeldin A-resistance guanine nucleotide exchange factor 1
MQASGVLLPPRATTTDDRPEDVQKRWQVTSERLEQFLPGFLSEIIPEESGQPQAIPEVSPEAPQK